MVEAVKTGDMVVVASSSRPYVDAMVGGRRDRADEGACGNQTKISKFGDEGCGRECEEQGRIHRDDDGPARQHGARRILARERRRGQRAERLGVTALMRGSGGQDRHGQVPDRGAEGRQDAEGQIREHCGRLGPEKNHPITFAAIDAAAAAKKGEEFEKAMEEGRSWTGSRRASRWQVGEGQGGGVRKVYEQTKNTATSPIVRPLQDGRQRRRG